VDPPREPTQGTLPAIEAKGLTKRYGSTIALSDFDLALSGGEVLGLIGANGAGKSTALKIISGTTPPTQGNMSISGEPVNMADYHPAVAARRGLYCVHQELSVCENLAVWENFAITDVLPGAKDRPGRAELRARAAQALRSVFPSNSIDPRAEVDNLSLAERQMVDVARAASHQNLSILVLDEPTSSLNSLQAQELRSALKSLRNHGTAVLYVTHKIGEILAIADRLVVLRAGNLQWSGPVKGLTKEGIVEALVGSAGTPTSPSTKDPLPPRGRPARDKAALPRPKPEEEGPPLLEAMTTSGLHAGQAGGAIVVRPGEIVGLAGVEGAGQRDLLLRAFAASRRRRRRTVARQENVVIRGQVAYLSGDRQREGVFSRWNIRENIVIGARSIVAPKGIVNPRKCNELGTEWFGRLGVAAPSPDAAITALSGGNQQKVLVGRALAGGADLLLLDDPTRGVDIPTKVVIYNFILQRVAQNHVGVLLYSTDDSEFEFCDRVYVMSEGIVVRELVGVEVSEETVARLAYGGGPQPSVESLGAAQ
jgi:ribose transport system ATP-binding protein